VAVDELLTVAQAASVLGIRPWTLRHWISAQKIEVVKYGNGSVRLKRSVLDRLVARSTIKAREPNARTGAKQSRFLQGSSVGPTTGRWLVEIRYPDGTRRRRRLRREREALRMWSAEQNKIDTGAWNQRAAKRVTLENALKDYRAYSKVQHRSHAGYVECALRLWERSLDIRASLAKISTTQIEAVKLRRAHEVSKGTVDKDLAVLKAFFNWCIGRGLAVSNPVRPVKLFREDNARLRYLTLEEYDRLLQAARAIKTSPYLEEKIVLAAHTGLRRGSLFNLRWEQVDLVNRVMRVPRTKNGRTLSRPLNATALATLQKLDSARSPGSLSGYVFPHTTGTHEGEPVKDIKNGFHAALALAEIDDFTWHDLRHTFASWLVMKGASLRSVGELLGHQSMKMTMRYAHLSPAFLSAEVRLLDQAVEPKVAAVPHRSIDPENDPPPNAPGGAKRARKGQTDGIGTPRRSEVPDFVRKIGSSGWTRTSNPPVNSRMLCH
jgi:excisionase family DNA binding protein